MQRFGLKRPDRKQFSLRHRFRISQLLGEIGRHPAVDQNAAVLERRQFRLSISQLTGREVRARHAGDRRIGNRAVAEVNRGGEKDQRRAPTAGSEHGLRCPIRFRRKNQLVAHKPQGLAGVHRFQCQAVVGKLRTQTLPEGRRRCSREIVRSRRGRHRKEHIGDRTGLQDLLRDCQRGNGKSISDLHGPQRKPTDPFSGENDRVLKTTAAAGE